MSEATIKIFDTPLGIDNVHDTKSPLFQPSYGRDSADTPRYLTVADNIDITPTGEYRSRVGRVKIRDLDNALNAWACSYGAFYVADDSIYRFEPGGEDILIVSELGSNTDVSFAEVEGQIFWCNGARTGRIIGSEAAFWGLQIVDPPLLVEDTGELRAGKYLVALAAVADGVEGGCRHASSITLSAQGGIRVVPTGIDPVAESLNVYVSDTNGWDLWFYKNVPVGQFVVTSAAPTTSLFTGLGAFQPPPGHIVRRWGGFLLVADNSTLYFSSAGNPHRFHILTDFQLFSSRIILVEPVVDGFYVGLEGGGLFWVQGEGPQSITLRRVDNRQVCEGEALRIPARKLPWLRLNTDTIVPVWLSEDGWVAGLPGGTVHYPVDGRIAMPANRKASISYVERPSLRQLMSSTYEPRNSPRLKFTDAMTMTVTKGGPPV